MSRHATRQKLALEFGVTDIVTERGDEGVARIGDLTDGLGADSVLECVGTQESMMQAIQSTRPGGSRRISVASEQRRPECERIKSRCRSRKSLPATGPLRAMASVYLRRTTHGS
jgi:threonine dehydrogenase-like Zn-dependent dehydrogenase